MDLVESWKNQRFGPEGRRGIVIRAYKTSSQVHLQFNFRRSDTTVLAKTKGKPRLQVEEGKGHEIFNLDEGKLRFRFGREEREGGVWVYVLG